MGPAPGESNLPPVGPAWDQQRPWTGRVNDGWAILAVGAGTGAEQQRRHSTPRARDFFSPLFPSSFFSCAGWLVAACHWTWGPERTRCGLVAGACRRLGRGPAAVASPLLRSSF